MGFDSLEKMSSDDIKLANETAHKRYLEGIAFDSMNDGQYMQTETGNDEESHGFVAAKARSAVGSQSDSYTSQIADAEQEKHSTSDDQAESVQGFHSEAVQANPGKENGVDDHDKASVSSAAPSGSLERIKTRFFSSKLSKHRQIYAKKFLLNCFLLGSLAIAMFSLYWGALYNHSAHYDLIKFIAVVDDDAGTLISPEVGNMKTGLIPILESATAQFDIYNTSTFYEKYGNDRPMVDKVHELVHKKNYWGSLIVSYEASNQLLASLYYADVAEYNSTNYFEFFYETARDLSNMRASILPLLTGIETEFKETFFYQTYLPNALANFPNATAVKVAGAANMKWNQIDNRPFNDFTLMGPMQVGLIYCILLTFFQLALFGPVHMMLSPLLKPKHIILYRLGTSWAAYFVLSLFFCTVSAIFQIDFTPAFGKGGFVVYWMTTWLLMGAVGGANENVLSLLLAYCPQYLGFWLISWIILNISPSFVPLVLANRLYRYGYMTPIYNALEIYRVIFMNTYKGEMGRNYGILVAWCVLNTALFPLVMKILARKFMNDAKKRATQK
ncbi:unnamed protein product [Kluyveromyces dobzhanskii CBS 2104]|uniref:WGS project CCBQ000000000 data, contig 00106 n=1 Tax=Kluyveromyces dobzhanskii CBS 2104 TaxID=1427455 RepID=A0A0A8L7I2_9SACH|nr:unnamed protein product [Kluyveromyces dobzhanskii CBS 2104]